MEGLTLSDRQNEFVMVNLRKRDGINKDEFANLFGPDRLAELSRNLGKYIKTGKVQESDSSYNLSREGKLFADGIAGDLFIR